MKNILYSLILFILLFLTACSDKDKSDTPAAESFMKATVDAKSFSISGTGSPGNTKGTSSVFQQSNSTLYLTGNDGITFVSFAIDKFTKSTGTFSFGDVNSGRVANYIDNSNAASPVNYYSKSGSLTITKFDGKTAEGTFSCTVYNQTLKKEIVISSGEFKVSYTEI